jgi:DNA invertase Pin-like site-specific DNA recombinase
MLNTSTLDELKKAVIEGQFDALVILADYKVAGEGSEAPSIAEVLDFLENQKPSVLVILIFRAPL